MSSDPTRSLPARLHLAQQKKLAKELLAAFDRGDTTARQRVRAYLPGKAEIALADAQFVLAREYGFASWAKLKAHVDQQSRPGPPPLEEFRTAVEQRDASSLGRLLSRHPEARDALNRPLFDFGAPALVRVAGSGDPALLGVLLDFGADPNRRSDWWAGGWHPLHTARGRGAELLMERGAVLDACAAANLDRPDLLRQMLEKEPGRVHERGGDGQTPLHFARSKTVVDLLLEYGADLDARDLDHRATPAQWMLERQPGAGRYALAEYLIARGAEADVFLCAALGLTDRLRDMLNADPSLLQLRTTRGEYGEKPPSSFHIYMWTIGANLSPLQVAAQFGHHDAIVVMNGFATPRERFLAACAEGRREEAHALLRQYSIVVAELDADEQRVLPDAGWAGNAEAVELMLDLGFDPFTPGQDTGMVLHCAAWQGWVACVGAALRSPAADELVRFREPTHGGTPLTWCVHGASHCRNPLGDYPAVARLLLEAGAEPGPGVEHAPAPVRRVIEEFSG